MAERCREFHGSGEVFVLGLWDNSLNDLHRYFLLQPHHRLASRNEISSHNSTEYAYPLYDLTIFYIPHNLPCNMWSLSQWIDGRSDQRVDIKGKSCSGQISFSELLAFALSANIVLSQNVNLETCQLLYVQGCYKNFFLNSGSCPLQPLLLMLPIQSLLTTIYPKLKQV